MPLNGIWGIIDLALQVGGLWQVMFNIVVFAIDSPLKGTGLIV